MTDRLAARGAVLAKARFALSAGRISGAEAARLEAALSIGAMPDAAVLARVFGSGTELRKALANTSEMRVEGCRSADAFDRLVADMVTLYSRTRGR